MTDRQSERLQKIASDKLTAQKEAYMAKVLEATRELFGEEGYQKIITRMRELETEGKQKP